MWTNPQFPENYIFCALIFPINTSFYRPNFQNVSNMIVKIREIQELSLVRVLIFNMQLQPQVTLWVIFWSISEINENHYAYNKNFSDRKMDIIPYVIIPWFEHFVKILERNWDGSIILINIILILDDICSTQRQKGGMVANKHIVYDD